MKQVLDIFFRAPGTRPWAVMLCLLAASLFEGIGLATLLPVIVVATRNTNAEIGSFEQFILDGIDAVGLSPDLTSLLAVVGIALVATALLTMVAMIYVGWASAEVATGFRRDIIRNLLDVRWSYLLHQPLGRFTNTLSIDVQKAAEAYQLCAVMVATAIQSVIYVVVALLISWKVALGGILVGSLLAVVLSVLVRRARRAGHSEMSRRRELLIFMSDVLNSMKPIKAMGRQGSLALLVEKKVLGIRKVQRRQVLAREMMNNADDAILAVLVCVGIYVIHIRMQVPIPEVIVSGLLLAKTVSSFGKLQKAFQKAVLIESSHRASSDLVAETVSARERFAGTTAPTLERSVRLRDVTFTHESEVGPVLRHVSLEVPIGQLTVLIGPSGSGKSTIVDLILGLHRPDSGQILIDDLDLEQVDLTRWRRMIGYVPQDLILLHDTIYANVALGDPGIGTAEVEEALRLAGALNFVRELPDGIMTTVGEKGGKLSGGERQRIALARALAAKPRLLVLDEVTSALDPTTAVAIAQEIKRLTQHLTVLAVTHRSEFVDVAGRVYGVGDGTVRDITAEKDRIEAPSPGAAA